MCPDSRREHCYFVDVARDVGGKCILSSGLSAAIERNGMSIMLILAASGAGNLGADSVSSDVRHNRVRHPEYGRH